MAPALLGTESGSRAELRGGRTARPRSRDLSALLSSSGGQDDRQDHDPAKDENALGDVLPVEAAGIEKNSFSVALIPQTLNTTTLGKVKIGDKVNIETDIIVKTIKKQLERILPQRQPLTVDKLKELGF